VSAPDAPEWRSRQLMVEGAVRLALTAFAPKKMAQQV
jgi:hypothetical protein